MNIKSCDACGRSATKRCGACGVVNYCSASHQRLFWPTHKLNCNLDKECHWIVQPYLNAGEVKALEHIKQIGGGNGLLESDGRVAVPWSDTTEEALRKASPAKRSRDLMVVRSVINNCESLPFPIASPITPALSPFYQYIYQESLFASTGAFDPISNPRLLHFEFMKEIFRFDVLISEAGTLYLKEGLATLLDASVERLQVTLNKLRTGEDAVRYIALFRFCDFRKSGFADLHSGKINAKSLQTKMSLETARLDTVKWNRRDDTLAKQKDPNFISVAMYSLLEAGMSKLSLSNQSKLNEALEILAKGNPGAFENPGAQMFIDFNHFSQATLLALYRHIYNRSPSDSF